MTMTGRRFHKGDKVEWKSHGTTVRGTVEDDVTSVTEAAGRTVGASKDEPQYKVVPTATSARARGAIH
jgi:DUF2945 family protein